MSDSYLHWAIGWDSNAHPACGEVGGSQTDLYEDVSCPVCRDYKAAREVLAHMKWQHHLSGKE